MIPSDDSSVVPTDAICAADERKVLCIVKDLTNATHSTKFTLNMPASMTVQAFSEEVARQVGYEHGTFSLIYERQDAGAQAQINLEAYREHELGAVCAEQKRNTFIINDKDGVQPVKVQSSDTGVSGISTISYGPSTQFDTTSSDIYSSTSSYSSYTYSSSLKSETGYVGLVNQAMTCYLNSLLQTLYMTPEFRNAVYRSEYANYSSSLDKNIPYQLQKLFLNLQTSDKKAIETTDITKSFGWDSSEAWHQHDVQELMRVMFDALEKKWKKLPQKELINELYQGQMQDYVKCLACNHESARTDTFLDIPLTIKPFGSAQTYNSVEESLEAFVEPETLNGNNQYFCEKCNSKQDAHKGLKFTKFPYILTLQLKRFDFDYTTMHRIKLNDRMSFPEVLNLNHLVDTDGKRSQQNTYKSQKHKAAAGDCNSYEENNGIGLDSYSKCSSNCLEPDVNYKNAHNEPGPYVYELLSIMIHSGSAAGGHYYAYIKSFKDNQWYSFNDQHVTAISVEDIKKTYGGSQGSSRTYYSSTYTSSTNAYMLVYRQIDKSKNEDFISASNFPGHLTKLMQGQKNREEEEKRMKELEKCTCKIKLFCFHPGHQKLLESKLEVHKDKTLAEATKIAYEQFELEDIIPLDCVRLVKYDEYHDYIDKSFDGDDQTDVGTVLGGVKSTYIFDLLLEVKRPDQEFQVYAPGGASIKVYVTDITSESIAPPISTRALLTQTIGEMKEIVAKAITNTLKIKASPGLMRCALEKYQRDLRPLVNDHKTLKQEDFFKSNKVYVECSGLESDLLFEDTKFFKLLDRYQHTIRLHVTLPPYANELHLPPPSSEDGTSPSTVKKKSCSSGDTTAYNCIRERLANSPPEASGAGDGLPEPATAGLHNDDDEENEDASSTKAESAHDQDMDLGSPGDAEQYGGASGGGREEEDWDAEIATNEAKNPNDLTEQEEEAMARYFSAHLAIDTSTKARSLTVHVDKRITLKALKKKLEEYVGTYVDCFKIYRIFGNNQEFEITRLSETLQAYSDNSKLNVRLGRALKKDEVRVKIFKLQPNESEPSRFLLDDAIIGKGWTVKYAKCSILADLKKYHSINIPVDRCRLRKKAWKNPGTVYLDNQVFDTDIPILPSSEFFIQELSGPEEKTEKDQTVIFMRYWHPSKLELGSFEEIVLSELTPETLKQKLHEMSGVPVENIQFGKPRGTFPCEVSVLDVDKDVDWEAKIDSLKMWPMNLDDGAVLFYRDKSEALAELSESQRRELLQKENIRLAKYNTKTSYSPRKEQALKIYTDESPNVSSYNKKFTYPSKPDYDLD